MNTKIGWMLVVLLAMCLSAMTLASAVKTSAAALSAGLTVVAAPQTKQDYPVRGEINRSFHLSPNAQIDVSGIEGAVKVETTNDNRAEIHFVRHARTQKDYDCETILVQDSPTSLTIKHQTDRSCRVIRAYEELTLIVPQSANLRFTGLEGSFAVGKTDGYLELRNIEGSVRAGEVQAAQIQNIEGGVTLSVARLDSQGITVRSVEGPVELRVADNINADLRVRGADSVYVDLPNVLNKRLNTNSFQSEDEDGSRRSETELQLGAGGARILISRIEGRVRVRGL
ncbi:MAG: hypothetical protein ACR2H4_14505 [Pyrinomonadaceae bacterium]